MHVNGSETFANGRGDGAFEGDLVGLDGGESALGEDVVVTLFECSCAGGELDPFDGEAGRLDDAPGSACHLRPNAIAGNQDDRVLGHIRS